MSQASISTHVGIVPMEFIRIRRTITELESELSLASLAVLLETDYILQNGPRSMPEAVRNVRNDTRMENLSDLSTKLLILQDDAKTNLAKWTKQLADGSSRSVDMALGQAQNNVDSDKWDKELPILLQGETCIKTVLEFSQHMLDWVLHDKAFKAHDISAYHDATFYFAASATMAPELQRLIISAIELDIRMAHIFKEATMIHNAVLSNAV